MISWLALGSALWLGIVTSISPCPLATNVAAISFLARRVGQEMCMRWLVHLPFDGKPQILDVPRSQRGRIGHLNGHMLDFHPRVS